MLAANVSRCLLLLAFALTSCGRSAAPADATKPVPPVSPAAPPPAEPAASHTRQHASLPPEEQRLEGRRQEALSELAQSALGIMFQDYLQAPDEASATRKSFELVKHVFAEAGPSITAISGLQLMAEDLYRRGQLDEAQSRRLLLLQGDLMQQQADAQSYPGEGIAYAAAIGALAALPLGSPLVRNGLKQLLRILAEHIDSLSEWDRLSSLYAGAPEVTASQFFSLELFKNYDLFFVAGKYFKYIGPLSFIYFYWFDYKEQARGTSIKVQAERLNNRDWEKFVGQLKDL